MKRMLRALRSIAAELVGIVADDWVLPLGIGALLLLAWLGVSRGGATAVAFGVAAATALWVAGISVADGRARRRSPDAVLHSKDHGRVPGGDRSDPQAARQAPR